MTWKEMIVYVLQNNLEDKEVFENGKINGFMTIPEAATKLEVGEATIKIWLELGYLEQIKVGETIFIPEMSKVKMI